MVRIKVDLGGAAKKMSPENFKRGQYALSNQMLADMTPFVPADDFILRNTGRANREGTQLIWDTPYAARLFYIYMHNYTTPGTGPRWDMKAKSMFMSTWIDTFVKGAEW